MPLPTKWNKKVKKPPAGFEIIEPVLEILENELRDKVKETVMTIRKNEGIWPIHQINYQKTRYVYDMYYTYHRITKDVYQYCIDQKLIDAALISKWKKTGYERLCSTYVINPMNYKFNTVSICRVPYKDRSKDQLHARDPTVRNNNIYRTGTRTLTFIIIVIIFFVFPLTFSPTFLHLYFCKFFSLSNLSSG